MRSTKIRANWTALIIANSLLFFAVFGYPLKQEIRFSYERYLLRRKGKVDEKHSLWRAIITILHMNTGYFKVFEKVFIAIKKTAEPSGLLTLSITAYNFPFNQHSKSESWLTLHQLDASLQVLPETPTKSGTAQKNLP